MEENLQEGRVYREERKREPVRLAVEQPAAALVDSGLENAPPSRLSVEEADDRQGRNRRYQAASAAIGAMSPPPGTPPVDERTPQTFYEDRI